jgi:chromosome partitioning protein
MTSIAFFNNKGGVGKTTLVYHLAWAYADLGMRVLAVDLDPQSNLTGLSVAEERLVTLWTDDVEQRRSIFGAVSPILAGLGDVREAHTEALGSRLHVLVGDVLLAGFEARLAETWPKCLDRDVAAFRAQSAFARLIQQAADRVGAELILIDVGPNLGAINRSALLAARWVVTPLGADFFSIQGLRNLGPVLRDWRGEWRDRRTRNPTRGLTLPDGTMEPVGYVVTQQNLYGGEASNAYRKWMDELPKEYSKLIAAQQGEEDIVPLSGTWELGLVKHYRSLMAMAHSARKPVFHLRAADGALGAHATAAQRAGGEFRALAATIAARVGVALPPRPGSDR